MLPTIVSGLSFCAPLKQVKKGRKQKSHKNEA